MFDWFAKFGLSLIGYGAAFNFFFWVLVVGAVGYFVWQKWSQIVALFNEAKAYYDHAPEIIADVQSRIDGVIQQGQEIVSQVQDAIPAAQETLERVPQILDEVQTAVQQIQDVAGNLAQLTELQAKLDLIQARLDEISGKLDNPPTV